MNNHSTAELAALRRGRRSERGSALIVTMLVIVAVTGLGALAFQTAVRSTVQARNLAESKQTEAVAETALMTGVQWLECNLPFLMDGNSANYPYQLSHEDPIGCGYSAEAAFGDNTFGTRQSDVPYFEIQFSQPVPARRAPEYDESYCYVRIDMLGRGGMLDEQREGSGARITDNRLEGGRLTRRFVANFYAGPVVCPGYGG